MKEGHEQRGRISPRRWGLLSLVSLTAVCATTPADLDDGLLERLPEADARILFVGNSLTYTNDLPLLVQTVAEAAGHTLAHATIARPNYSLEDHWNAGAREVILTTGADFVVMQQGPSSLPASQEYLRTWTERIAPVIREAGGRPALYMVWPDDTRLAFFDDVRESYQGAAVSVDGLFIPAGETWREAWDAGLTRPLYGPDGFHPSRLGSEVAALAIVRAVYGEPLTDLPARMMPTTAGLPTVDLGDDAALILEAVEAAWSATRD
ncbi:MAG: hypothetical protein AAF389_20530 [Gemmatimonadota bacterium]